MLVTVKMDSASGQPARVAIFKGACASKPPGKPTYMLGQMTGGALQATIHNATIATMVQSPNMIVVAQNPPLCGDIGTANPIPGTQQGSPAASPQP